MKYPSKLLITLLLFVISIQTQNAQHLETNKNSETKYSRLKLRGIGPAFMSGRIADIAINPNNESMWYVAVGSGGVWKTINSGTTWSPIFDEQSSYSIGCVAIDPNNTNTIWVGTGEDVGGRHVGIGDGVYKSLNAGKTWMNMGLKNSQHISRVIIHPNNSNIIWVTAQGPLWNKGGERGVFKSTDGGNTWKRTLGNDQWTGATELVYDSKNPDIMYAATWDRHRTVAAYMGGGPGTALYKSNDGGDTWLKLSNGLPDKNMGKIGLAISPHNSNVLYAAIELERRKGAVYKSTDQGHSWVKQSDVVSGGTGPHYYQELFVSPHHKNRLYLMDNTMQISEDGGKTFYRMNRKNKHGDNHAIAFRKNDPNYLLVGTDGGLYESFDLTKSWKYVENLPVTQFYKVAVDDTKPFYNIYGGTQDNSTQGGPSRTNSIQGIQNSDWRVILNWDGHQPAVEPGNPRVVYAERQEGTLSRIDMHTGEVVDIQPQPDANEKVERFNWDAPILVSPHSPKTIYFASQRIWKSENRGDTWKAISKDLTKNEERFRLPIMGKQQSFDNAWDVYAMSNYNTITSLAESPFKKGLLYAGTDDGYINITEDDGANWQQIKVSKLPGVPETAFVNDIKADLHDVNTVYVALDNHKYGDFKPYLYKSSNRGKTWSSISNSIPENHLVWRLVQDHVSPNLLFIGTEYGLFFSSNGGSNWQPLKGNVPTISFRDLAIQKRENDLVAASFGRGFYILDDYSPLRYISGNELEDKSVLFPVRDAWWYIPRSHLGFDKDKGSQGDSHFVAPNPDFGAVFTYYLNEVPAALKKTKQKKENQLKNSNVPFPNWEALSDEMLEKDSQILFVIKDGEGNIVRNILSKAKSGINRVSWDLRYPNLSPVLLNPKTDKSKPGLLAPPGAYNVTMYVSNNGSFKALSEPVEFTIKPLYQEYLNETNQEKTFKFWRLYEDIARQIYEFDLKMSKTKKQIKALQLGVTRSHAESQTILNQLNDVDNKLNILQVSHYGNSAKKEVGEKTKPTISQRLSSIYRGLERSTYGPTNTHEEQLNIVIKQLNTSQKTLNDIQTDIETIRTVLQSSKSPYIEK
ncbi:VPS10 domain-containing protein [Cognatitamlana onchidii]|uniref:VPS10 domain-containing protein n=1 Tax=Cognatitamlana onchidii TaxID=2562860 RepID=UPI0010A5F704|nr:glycosyl hydrolase [Algibacter onchidii]